MALLLHGLSPPTATKRIGSLYSQAVKKIMDKNQICYHHFTIKKYNLISFDSFISFSFLKLFHNGVEPEPLLLLRQNGNSH